MVFKCDKEGDKKTPCSIKYPIKLTFRIEYWKPNMKSHLDKKYFIQKTIVKDEPYPYSHEHYSEEDLN